MASGAEAERRVLISHDAGGASAEPSSTGVGSYWEGTSLHLQHPRTGEPTQYMVVAGQLHEINWVKERYRSWFVGDSVISDGGLFLSTPVDPLFLALPILEASRRMGGRAQGAFQEQEQLLQTEASRECAELARLLGDGFAHVCDVKHTGDDAYYRLSNDKVMAWLRCKLQRLRGALAGSSTSYALDEAALTVYAVRLLGEYLSEQWSRRLCDACGVAPVAEAADGQPLQPVNAERRHEEPLNNKRPKLDAKEVARKRAAENKAEAKAAQVRRETRGMKSISALFGSYKCKDNVA